MTSFAARLDTVFGRPETSTIIRYSKCASMCKGIESKEKALDYLSLVDRKEFLIDYTEALSQPSV